MCRWAIVLNRQMLFTTDEESVARRFLVMGFQIFDHINACYTFLGYSEQDLEYLLANTPP